MIAERPHHQDNEFAVQNNTKYYQFSTIFEHVLECFHTIVSDETNPYHPPLGWLTRRQPKPPDDELFLDLIDECNKNYPAQQAANYFGSGTSPGPLRGTIQLSSSVRTRLERCPQQLRKEIVSRTQNGDSPLFLACRNGLIRVIKYLLDVCDADIEQKGLFEAFEDRQIHEVSPIWVAAVSNQIDVVRLLIDRGADINSVSDTGSTPIRSVCFLCQDEDNAYSNYDNEDDDLYPFGNIEPVDSSQDDYVRIVHLLAENGADISRPNNSGGTCLINSLHNNRLTAYMISRGADINAADNQSKTALHYAIQQDRLQVARLLLQSGANPYLTTNTCDDALQLCCIGGQIAVFNYLIENYSYDQKRLSDAYKLLGSSIFELHCDYTLVRRLWTKSLILAPSRTDKDEKTRVPGATHSADDSQESQPSESTNSLMAITTTSQNNLTGHSRERERQTQAVAKRDCILFEDLNSDIRKRQSICENRRSIAYGDLTEISSLRELNDLVPDDFRIQSLLITERILGQKHREIIQRLLYRGTFFINSLRTSRCLDLWIYALSLRLESDSIYHYESIFAAQAITKFFLDLYGQRQQQQVKFNDVYDVLSMLVIRLHECPQPKDTFDTILNIIVNLLLVLRCSRRHKRDCELTVELTRKLIKLNPLTSKGCSLLHICVAPNMFEGETQRSLLNASSVLLPAENANDAIDANDSGQFNSIEPNYYPLIELIDNFIRAGLDVDSANNDGLSALQTICLATSIRMTDKRRIVRLLVQNGAHIDRRALTLEQEDQIRQALRESGVKVFNFVTLKCLAARKVAETMRKSANKTTCNLARLSRNLNELIAIH